jgi:hypothetical protein
VTHNISNYLFYIIPIAAAIPLLASLTIFIQPSHQQYLKYFALFLIVNFLLDSATNYYALQGRNNVVLSNIDSLLVISCELFLLRKMVYGKRAKKVILAFLIGYPSLFLIYIFVQSSGTYQNMTYSIGCLLLVTSCIYYFWELFQQKYSVNLLRQPAFWICSGLLFYYTCTFPLYGFVNFLNALPKIILQNLFQIFILLNIFQYLSFTIAFLCRLKLRKSM